MFAYTCWYMESMNDLTLNKKSYIYRVPHILYCSIFVFWIYDIGYRRSQGRIQKFSNAADLEARNKMGEGSCIPQNLIIVEKQRKKKRKIKRSKKTIRFNKQSLNFLKLRNIATCLVDRMLYVLYILYLKKDNKM